MAITQNMVTGESKERYTYTAKARSRMGPVSFASVVIFLGSGVGMIFYFRYEKARVERKRIAEASKGMGRPKVGGIFELIDQDGKPFSSEDGMKGRFSLVYFGFTHCPDICPEELDKMSQTLDILNPPKADQSPQSSTTSSSTADASTPTSSIWHPSPSTPALLPVFITCDPARDTPGVLKTYLAEFHPTIVGLTGTWEQIKAVCKLYRVYFSTPEGVKPGMDYLVDHSIYFYLMDPEGDFVEAIGRQHSPEQAARIIGAHMRDWERTGRTSLDPR
ncbi:Cu-binding protein [Agyrium rufum]|nr:Cu-binding protein [Agyrium rufum]